MRILLLLVLGLSFAQGKTIEKVRATGYTHTEADHFRYGRLNCQGGQLDESQCAADLTIYPLGTRLEITTPEGRKLTRTVADCGGAVKGRRHVDIYWRSKARMYAWGTQIVTIRVTGMVGPRDRPQKATARLYTSKGWRYC